MHSAFVFLKGSVPKYNQMKHYIIYKVRQDMYFRRKAYEELLRWKENYADHYAVLLEGARRVGKSTIAERFAAKEYRSYILVDFSMASKEEIACFDDISDLDLFYLRLQTVKGVDLYVHESVVIFDEAQLFPKARQAIKHLVKDGRYHYIETGSFLIPSEEMKITVYPMDYEEFCGATGNNYSMLETIYEKIKSLGQQVNRKLMRDLRIYMAAGGMPQAVETYVNGDNFARIDQIKRQIIRLYEDDFKRLDPSGKLSAIYHSIPAQLSRDMKRYRLASAVGKRKTQKEERLIYDLIDSKTVLPAYNMTDPRVSLTLTKDLDSYKMYVADKLPANLGYLYENLVAQMIAASGRELYYHTWEKEGSTHYYEIDFLISQGTKVFPLEVKSSGTGKHESLSEFRRKYSRNTGDCIVISQKDLGKEEEIRYLPVYLTPFLCR